MKTATPTWGLIRHHRRKVLSMASDFQGIATVAGMGAAPDLGRIEKLNAIATLLLTAADDMEELSR